MVQSPHSSDQPLPALSPLPSRPIVKISSRLLRGVKKVQSQIKPYALQWHEANRKALHKEGPTWFVLGDSMAQGVGASSFDNGWVGQLHRQMEATGIHYRLINLSMSGGRIEHVTNVQIPAMKALGVHPDLITVLIGSNDLVNSKYRRHIGKNYREMLEQLPQTHIVTAPLGDFGKAAVMTKIMREYASEGKLIVAENTLKGLRGKTAEDRFHPNDRGYADIAQIFANVLIKRI